jgi:hypothetical protein
MIRALICSHLSMCDVCSLIRTSNFLSERIKNDNLIWRRFVREDKFAANDWLSSDAGWLASQIGRKGRRMRTDSDSWFDKMNSSMEDPLDNLLKGNFLFYKIFEVIYLFCFSF